MRLTSSKSGNRRVSLLSSLAPLISLALLLIYPWAFAEPYLDPGLLRERHSQVKEAIDNLPEKLGKWIKVQDVVIPTGALSILNPNAHVSRRYQRIGEGRSVFATVMVIHCSDVRDMSMHYPPVCYPRSGWTLLGENTRDWAFKHGENRQINGRTYSFARLGNNGLDRVITVADTFLLPGGVSTRDMSDLLHVASQYRNSIQGVAQVQIYYEGNYQSEEAMSVLEQMTAEIINGLPDNLLEVLDGQFALTTNQPIEGSES